MKMTLPPLKKLIPHRCRIIYLVCLSAWSSLSYAQTAAPNNLSVPPPNGRDIIQKQEGRDNGFHDETLMGHMILKGTNGEKMEREFESRRFEKQGTTGEKSLIKFIRPADIQGTGLLSYQNKKEDDDQWLYLPSMKKIKRIAGTGKSGSFVGSEFSFEDLIPPDIEKYSYEYLRTEPCDEVMCFVVQSTPLTPDSGYSKTILWIRTDNYRNTQVEFYDKKDRLLKILSLADYRLMNNKYWRAFRLIMKNKINGKETDFLIENLKIGAGLTNADFTQRALER